MSRTLRIKPLAALPEIEEGAHLGTLIADRERISSGDIVVIAQKIVSKAEGRIVDLTSVTPGPEATALATEVDKDPRLVELILDESRAIIRKSPGVLIVETTSGWVCANAGIDASNIPGDHNVALLPTDADDSARRIRDEITETSGTRPGVVITDSFGRPWRLGQTDIAIGCAGLPALDDWRGRTDREGRELAAAAPALIDQIAAAADLTRGKDGGAAVIIISGLDDHVTAADGEGARPIQRPADEDLFR